MRIIEKFPLRIRLTLVYTFWIAVFIPIMGWSVYRVVQSSLLQSVDGALSAAGQAMVDARAASGPGAILDELLSTFLGDREINASTRIVDLSGNVRPNGRRGRILLPLTKNSARRAEAGLSTFESFEDQGKPKFRMLTLPVISGGFFTGDVVQVAASLESTDKALKRIENQFWLAMPIGILVSFALSYYLAGRSLMPIRAIQHAASGLKGSDLSKRLVLPKAEDEIKGLTVSFNEMLDRLEDSFTRLRRFSSDVSHELRTPLAAIRGEVDLALRRERSQSDYKATIESVQRESLHMSKIVEDLLLLAKAESRTVAYQPQPTSLSSIVEFCVDATRFVFEEKFVILKVAEYSEHTLTCMSGYLNQALINILTNAAKHSPKDSQVDFSVVVSSSEVTFIVQDHGEGIPKEDIAKVFDAFFRVDSARNRDQGGTGIGLSLASALVRMHGGAIEVSSEIGRGSEFRVRIPAV